MKQQETKNGCPVWCGLGSLGEGENDTNLIILDWEISIHFQQRGGILDYMKRHGNKKVAETLLTAGFCLQIKEKWNAF